MTQTQMQWRNDRGAPHRLYSRHSTPRRALQSALFGFNNLLFPERSRALWWNTRKRRFE